MESEIKLCFQGVVAMEKLRAQLRYLLLRGAWDVRVPPSPNATNISRKSDML